jgi:hypothetical protein
MSITKQTSIDKIEVLEMGQVQVREVTRIMEDGNELSASYHRWVLAPADSLEGQDGKVVAVCNAVWTAEVIAAYQAMVAAQQQQV